MRIIVGNDCAVFRGFIVSWITLNVAQVLVWFDLLGGYLSREVYVCAHESFILVFADVLYVGVKGFRIACGIDACVLLFIFPVVPFDLLETSRCNSCGKRSINSAFIDWFGVILSTVSYSLLIASLSYDTCLLIIAFKWSWMWVDFVDCCLHCMLFIDFLVVLIVFGDTCVWFDCGFFELVLRNLILLMLNMVSVAVLLQLLWYVVTYMLIVVLRVNCCIVVYMVGLLLRVVASGSIKYISLANVLSFSVSIDVVVVMLLVMYVRFVIVPIFSIVLFRNITSLMVSIVKVIWAVCSHSLGIDYRFNYRWLVILGFVVAGRELSSGSLCSRYLTAFIYGNAFDFMGSGDVVYFRLCKLVSVSFYVCVSFRQFLCVNLRRGLLVSGAFAGLLMGYAVDVCLQLQEFVRSCRITAFAVYVVGLKLPRRRKAWVFWFDWFTCGMYMIVIDVLLWLCGGLVVAYEHVLLLLLICDIVLSTYSKFDSMCLSFVVQLG
eukprot:gene13097-8943_t